MYYLLLDEIQMLDCFEAVLNGYLRKNNMDVFVTGSNAKLLSKDIATEFAGRGDEVHMYPLSFAEFMTIYSGDKYMGLSEYSFLLQKEIRKVRLSVNSLKLILYAILVLPDAISSLHTRCRMKRNALRKSDRSEKLMIPSKRLLSQKILYSPIMMTMVS